jgi:bile acid:Na+ symporter, BASS family
MTPLLDIALPLLVICVMTLVGMEIRPADFRRVRRYPTLIPAIVIGHWLLLMTAAALIGKLPGLPNAVAGGMLLIAAAPVAALSNYYAQLAHGQLALAVTVTAVSNALAVVATPLVATVGFRLFLGEAVAFELPFANVVQQSVTGLLLPLLAGMAIRHYAAQWTLRWRARLHGLGLLAIAAVFAAIVASQFETIRDQLGIFIAASLMFTLAMLATGLLAARLLVRPVEERRALVWGFPARNLAVAMLIAGAAREQDGMASFIAVLFATQLAVFVPLGLWLKRQACRTRSA